jgi:hypothetical protein
MDTIMELCQLGMEYYYVGYTSGSALHLEGGHKGWDHVVLLADRMKMKEALDLEAAIHDGISDVDRRSAIWKLYHPEKKRYDKKRQMDRVTVRRNNGGHKPKGAVCSVYMMWLEA